MATISTYSLVGDNRIAVISQKHKIHGIKQRQLEWQWSLCASIEFCSQINLTRISFQPWEVSDLEAGLHVYHNGSRCWVHFGHWIGRLLSLWWTQSKLVPSWLGLLLRYLVDNLTRGATRKGTRLVWDSLWHPCNSALHQQFSLQMVDIDNIVSA